MSETHRAPDSLMQELEAAEKDPEVFYKVQLAALKIGRDMGFPDDVLEKSLGIKLRPEDRQKED